MKPTIAITAGDINGVGYEVLIKSLANSHITEICRPVVYGNSKVARQHLQKLDEEYRNIQWNIIQDPKQAKDGRLNLISCYSDDTPLQLGTSTPEAGQAAFKSLQRACQDLKKGLVDALVTAPINKDNIQSDDFRFAGHTEYLTEQFGEGKDSLMMMISEQMRVALVCNHTPIAKVAETITVERILNKLTILDQTLKTDFTIRKPRIAVWRSIHMLAIMGSSVVRNKQLLFLLLPKHKNKALKLMDHTRLMASLVRDNTGILMLCWLCITIKV